MRSACAICLAAAVIGGCGGAGEKNIAQAPDPFATPTACTSGLKSHITESEGPMMGPGWACNTCHADSNAASGENDAPIFAFAGTVYPSAHEPKDCVASGSFGAEVEITDATGNVFTQPVNAVGNFFDETPAFAFPYSATVKFEGRERRMLSRQAIGDCNACHTEQGDVAAPGRILLP